MKSILVSLAYLFFCSTASAQRLDRSVVNPVGDELLGNLKVNCPKLPSGYDKVPTGISLGNSYFNECGDTLRLLESTYNLFLTGKDGAGVYSKELVTVKKQKTTEVFLAGLLLDWDQSLTKVSIGPRSSIKVSAPAQEFEQEFEMIQAWGEDVQGQPRFWPVFAGDYDVEVKGPKMAPIRITLKDGEVFSQKLKLVDQRTTIEILPPAKAFEDGLATEKDFDRAVYLIYRNADIGNSSDIHFPETVVSNGDFYNGGKSQMVEFEVVPVGTGTSLNYYPQFGTTPVVHELLVNNTSVILDGLPGENKKIQLKRLDVNDVLITREDGTTFYAKGNYKIQISKIDSNGKSVWVDIPLVDYDYTYSRYLVRSELPTKTGVTVLPGLYKVLISYTALDGDKSTEQVVDLL